MVSPAVSHIRVAVVGGGIAGVTLTQALLQVGNVDVHLFESAPAIRESGMGIGLGRNGVTALELLGLQDRLNAANAVQTNGAKAYIAQGPDTGELGVNVELDKSWGVIRSTFLRELLRGVDEKRLHTGKKLTTFIEQEDIVLAFEDGSTHTCDVLIGADGIHSTIRKFVLGSEEAAAPSFAGWQGLWIDVPYDDVLQGLGSKLVNRDDPAQFAWCSEKTWVMHALTFDSKLCSCILSRRFGQENIKGPVTTSKTELLDWVSHFDHPVGKAMVELMTRDKSEGILMFPTQHHYPPTKTYAKGRVAIVGDAANASTPWRGSAGSMSIEDALIISSCFAQVKDRAGAVAALKAYETVQMPRRSKLVTESYRAGMIMTGCDGDVGLDAKKMRETLTHTWEWIHTVNLEDQVKKALELMEDALK